MSDGESTTRWEAGLFGTDELRSVLESMTEVILVLDRDGRFLSIAHTNPSLLFRPREEMLGRTVGEVFSAEQGASFLDTIRGTLASGLAREHEYALTIGGAEIWFSAVVSRLDPDTVVWVARDITDRKHAELHYRQALEEQIRARSEAEEARRRYSFLLDASSILASTSDCPGTLRSVCLLAVPALADLCALDLLVPGGGLQRCSVVHRDGGQGELCRRLQEQAPRDIHPEFAELLRTGRSLLHPRTEAAEHDYFNDHPAYRAALRDAGINSCLHVPLITRDHAFGVIHFCSTDPERRYSETDLAAAEDLARCAAVAVYSGRRWRALSDKLEHLASENRTLTAERDRMVGSLEDLPVGVLVVSGRDGEELVVERRSRRAEEILGRELTPGSSVDELATNWLAPGVCPEPLGWRGMGAPAAPMERELIRPDGTRVALLFSSRPLPGHPGEQRMAMTFEDISTRKLWNDAQEFLIQAHIVLGSTLDYEANIAKVAAMAVPQLVEWMFVDLVGADGAIRPLVSAHANPTKARHAQELAQRLIAPPGLNHGAAHVIRTGAPDAFPPSDGGDGALGVEHPPLLRSIGATTYLSVPICGREGCVGAITVARGHAGRRLGQRSLEVLERLAIFMGFAIDNARLYQSAETARRTRDDMLGVVVHELRNPLSAMLLSARALSDKAQPEYTAQKLEVITRSGERLRRLIDQLLDLSRMAAGRFSVAPSPQEVGALVTATAEQARDRAKGVHLAIHLPAGLPLVLADRDRILQVLGNLVDNALKFTPPGGRIRVGAEPAAENVRLFVSNTGRSISAEQLPHLFEPYWQAKRGDSRGAGLGLPISKGIVEAHGGQIWVESRHGQGTIFFFTLPVAPTTVH